MRITRLGLRRIFQCPVPGTARRSELLPLASPVSSVRQSLYPRVSASCLVQPSPIFQSNGRSPQERTLTFPALLPYLLLWLLVVLGFVVICQLAQPHSLIGFVCLRSQVCSQLPPWFCLCLTVGTTTLCKGLSSTSQRSCWAHKWRCGWTKAHPYGEPNSYNGSNSYGRSNSYGGGLLPPRYPIVRSQ